MCNLTGLFNNPTKSSMIKKTILLSAAILISFCSIQQVKGQIWLRLEGQGMLSKNSFTGGSGVRGLYEFGEESNHEVGLGFTYNFTVPVDFDITLVDTLGFYDTVESSVVSTLMMLDLDYRRYLWQSDPDDEFGIYTTVGISAWMLGTKVNLPYFNDTLLSPALGVNLTNTNISMHLPVGVGIDWTIRGLFWWFLEARISLPITPVSDDYVAGAYGVGFHFSTGARILLADL